MTTKRKTCVIVGKGPSAREFHASDPRVICALNGAARLCGRIDYLFVNDVSALSELDGNVMLRVNSLVLPTELHITTDGAKTQRYDQMPNWFLESPQIHLYRLPSAKEPTGAPSLGKILSVGETAAAWLTLIGYKRFLTSGIDPDQPTYHAAFSGGPQKSKEASWYRTNWQRICKRVRDAEGTIDQIPPIKEGHADE